MTMQNTHYNQRDIEERLEASGLNTALALAIQHAAPSRRISSSVDGHEHWWPKAHVEAWIKLFTEEEPVSTSPDVIESCADFIVSLLNKKGLMVPEYERRQFVAELSNKIIRVVVPSDNQTSPEKILFNALVAVLDKLQGSVVDMPSEEAYPIYKSIDIVRQALFDYADKVELKSRQVRWNWQGEGKRPLDTRECHDHPAVRGTTYMEISDLLGTSGCSKEEPYWVWSCMGIIETNRGKQVVCPGDWIVEPIKGLYQVLTHEQFMVLYQ